MKQDRSAQTARGPLDLDFGGPRPRMVEPIGIRGSVGVCRGCRNPAPSLHADGKCDECTTMPALPTPPTPPRRRG